MIDGLEIEEGEKGGKRVFLGGGSIRLSRTRGWGWRLRLSCEKEGRGREEWKLMDSIFFRCSVADLPSSIFPNHLGVIE